MKNQTMINFKERGKEIFDLWDKYAKTGNIEGLLSLYAEDAHFETPLVPILMEREDGTLKNKKEIEKFFIKGTNKRPNELVRWYRTGKYFINGNIIIWEYPRETPNGNQVDIIEFIEMNDQGEIKHHKIYWGWFGTSMLINSELKKVR